MINCISISYSEIKCNRLFFKEREQPTKMVDAHKCVPKIFLGKCNMPLLITPKYGLHLKIAMLFIWLIRKAIVFYAPLH